LLDASVAQARVASETKRLLGEVALHVRAPPQPTLGDRTGDTCEARAANAQRGVGESPIRAHGSERRLDELTASRFTSVVRWLDDGGYPCYVFSSGREACELFEADEPIASLRILLIF
jgi:hypothetical protein